MLISDNMDDYVREIETHLVSYLVNNGRSFIGGRINRKLNVTSFK